MQAKKIETHLKKHRNTGHGYNNEENPFGDSNLGDSFVWGKKIQKQLDEGADKRDLTAKAERQRQIEREVRWQCDIEAGKVLPALYQTAGTTVKCSPCCKSMHALAARSCSLATVCSVLAAADLAATFCSSFNVHM